MINEKKEKIIKNHRLGFLFYNVGLRLFQYNEEDFFK